MSKVSMGQFQGDPTKQVQLRGHDDELTAFALSPACTVLHFGSDVCGKASCGNAGIRIDAVAMCCRERRLFVLDTATGKIVSNTTLLEPKRTKALAWSPVSGPCYTFATAADYDIYVYSLDPFKGWVGCEKVTTGTVRRTITCLCFSADGSWLFAGTASGDVLTINVARRAVQLMHTVASGGIGAVLLSADGKVLAGAADGSLCLLDLPNGNAVDRGAQLLVGTQHGDIFSVAAGSGRVSAVMESQLGAIRDLVWTAESSGSMATASDNGSVCVWNTASLGLECRVQHHGVAAQSVALSPQLLLSGWSDGFIHCHSRAGPKPGTPLWCIPNAHATAHSCGVPALQLSHRGHFVASGGAGGEIRVWDLASREMVSHMKHHVMGITDLKVMVDDSHLLAASEDRTWTIWDMNSEKLSKVYRAAMGAVRGVAMGPDQVSVASVGLDKGIFLWDIRKDTPVRVVPDAHLHEITCVAINRAGTLIATGGADCAVKLWDFGSGRPVGMYAGHTSTVNKLQFSPDDNQLASVANDGTHVLWQFGPGTN
ncbi:flagellar associated protein [Scenedesmus sp. NREL 46B-D3]|nr:flagellar associated protein [Scenedesmus sp. NREL 46B-D3]